MGNHENVTSFINIPSGVMFDNDVSIIYFSIENDSRLFIFSPEAKKSAIFRLTDLPKMSAKKISVFSHNLVGLSRVN